MEQCGLKLAHQFPWAASAYVAVGLALRRRELNYPDMPSSAPKRKQIMKVGLPHDYAAFFVMMVALRLMMASGGWLVAASGLKIIAGTAPCARSCLLGAFQDSVTFEPRSDHFDMLSCRA